MWHHNVELLAYHDLDGRSGFKLALQEVEGRFFLYVAGFSHSGWSILEVTESDHPELLRFVEGPVNTMTLQVQVADRVMITGLEHPFPGLPLSGPPVLGCRQYRVSPTGRSGTSAGYASTRGQAVTSRRCLVPGQGPLRDRDLRRPLED